jgi:hypothetical protein
MNTLLRLFYLVITIGIATSEVARADLLTPADFDQRACNGKNAGEICTYPEDGLLVGASYPAGSQGLCRDMRCHDHLAVYDDAGEVVLDDSGVPIEGSEGESYECLFCSGIINTASDSGSSLFFDAATIEERDASTHIRIDGGSHTSKEASADIGSETDSESESNADCGCRIRSQSNTPRTSLWIIAGAASLFFFYINRRRF